MKTFHRRSALDVDCETRARALPCGGCGVARRDEEMPFRGGDRVSPKESRLKATERLKPTPSGQ